MKHTLKLLAGAALAVCLTLTANAGQQTLTGFDGSTSTNVTALTTNTYAAAASQITCQKSTIGANAQIKFLSYSATNATATTVWIPSYDGSTLYCTNQPFRWTVNIATGWNVFGTNFPAGPTAWQLYQFENPSAAIGSTILRGYDRTGL